VVRCEAAVGSDVGEDLLDQGEHMGVVDGVDVAAAVSACAEKSAKRSLLRCWLMVATPTNDFKRDLVTRFEHLLTSR
jgi:hypothetical protein